MLLQVDILMFLATISMLSDASCSAYRYLVAVAANFHEAPFLSFVFEAPNLTFETASVIQYQT